VFTVSNNMIDAKKSRVRLYRQIPSNKEIVISKYHLPTKFSRKRDSIREPNPLNHFITKMHVLQELGRTGKVSQEIQNIILF